MSPTATILVVEDDRRLSELLATILAGEDYLVTQALSGEEAVQKALQRPPDLILLDLLLPNMSGFDVLGLLRAEPKTMHVPVIMLTASQEISDKLRAFDLYVNDYLTKPFNSDELLARVKSHLHHSQAILLSPLTKLPGGEQIERAIEQRLATGTSWAFLYLDLDNFKALNDGYGFWRGNEMIRLLMGVVVDAVRTNGNTADFVGHIGGEDFVVLTTPDRVNAICTTVISRFSVASRGFYRAEDLARGAFLAVGRNGPQQFHPLVTISIAVVLSDRLDGAATLDALSRRAAIIKARTKATTGNCYMIDGEDQVRYAQDDAAS